MPIAILMPALSPTMTEGNLLKWHKKVGDSVKAGEVLAEIETDKATMEVEAVDEGTLGRILVEEKTEGVKVNTPIAVLLEKGEKPADLDSFKVASVGPAPTQEAAPHVPEPVATHEIHAPVSSQERVFASPLAKRLAQEKSLDLHSIQGSGPHGRIVKKDVEGFSGAGGRSFGSSTRTAATGPEFRDVALSSMRKVIAKRLLESKQTVPHFYLTADCHLDSLMAIRKSLNESIEGIKLTVNDFIIKASALALQDVPAANATWMGDSIRYYRDSDVAVAVALEDGLITPILRQAHVKSVFDISSEMKQLAKKAKENKLRPDEFQGGSFSISNLGMYNIPQFGAIINPPQAGILAVGAGQQRPVVEDGEIFVATVMTCTLSVDHRVIDGKTGADFLNAIKNYLENPALMLI
ncbi:MAG: pyruvate dehydrogenase complex dihydrolipoamide acetyltransferase [Alphaproteobacteria bacterium]